MLQQLYISLIIPDRAINISQKGGNFDTCIFGVFDHCLWKWGALKLPGRVNMPENITSDLVNDQVIIFLVSLKYHYRLINIDLNSK